MSKLPKIEPQFEDVEVEGVGTLSMRPLTSGEVKDLQGGDVEGIDLEAAVARLALGDTDEVEEWYLGLPRNLGLRVFNAAMRLSGQRDDTDGALGN